MIGAKSGNLAKSQTFQVCLDLGHHRLESHTRFALQLLLLQSLRRAHRLPHGRYRKGKQVSVDTIVRLCTMRKDPRYEWQGMLFESMPADPTRKAKGPRPACKDSVFSSPDRPFFRELLIQRDGRRVQSLVGGFMHSPMVRVPAERSDRLGCAVACLVSVYGRNVFVVTVCVEAVLETSGSNVVV